MCAGGGFTMIEILIVVVIVAIIAASIIPSLTSSADDARQSTMEYNLHELQKQIDAYKIQHLGVAPVVVEESLPQLLSSTDEGGEIGAGPDYPFGPYIQGGEIPINPVAGSNAVRAVAKFPIQIIGWDGGWLYHESSGRIMANQPGSAVIEASPVTPVTPVTP